jgi:hypothetical protein
MTPPVSESAIPLFLTTGTTSQTELAARDALDGRRKGMRAFLPFAGRRSLPPSVIWTRALRPRDP